ncbi:hypothetical protein CYMTET_38157 [Cymbomonas tetramitiformis]|uniref:Uncharacterized protein n=1 Tax=Cymbomonas tetramitiformis TaxID=36881 RepID=A0AAE0CE06_9CHLO|nr:hypothetical protein CYMTET_38157 [Cymbomonas tetramitiformis]
MPSIWEIQQKLGKRNQCTGKFEKEAATQTEISYPLGWAHGLRSLVYVWAARKAAEAEKFAEVAAWAQALLALVAPASTGASLGSTTGGAGASGSGGAAISAGAGALPVLAAGGGPGGGVSAGTAGAHGVLGAGTVASAAAAPSAGAPSLTASVLAAAVDPHAIAAAIAVAVGEKLDAFGERLRVLEARGCLGLLRAVHSFGKAPMKSLEAHVFDPLVHVLPELRADECELDELPAGREAMVEHWRAFVHLLQDRVGEFQQFVKSQVQSFVAISDVMVASFFKKRKRITFEGEEEEARAAGGGHGSLPPLDASRRGRLATLGAGFRTVNEEQLARALRGELAPEDVTRRRSSRGQPPPKMLVGVRANARALEVVVAEGAMVAAAAAEASVPLGEPKSNSEAPAGADGVPVAAPDPMVEADAELELEHPIAVEAIGAVDAKVGCGPPDVEDGRSVPLVPPGEADVPGGWWADLRADEFIPVWDVIGGPRRHDQAPMAWEMERLAPLPVTQLSLETWASTSEPRRTRVSARWPQLRADILLMATIKNMEACGTSENEQRFYEEECVRVGCAIPTLTSHAHLVAAAFRGWHDMDFLVRRESGDGHIFLAGWWLPLGVIAFGSVEKVRKGKVKYWPVSDYSRPADVGVNVRIELEHDEFTTVKEAYGMLRPGY